LFFLAQTKQKTQHRKTKRLPVQMPEKNKTQNEDKQNKEHNTENLKDYQYRCQEKQTTECL
jgi:hypothetical protein